MMKSKLTFAFFFLIAFASLSLKAQTTWVKQQLDNRISVKFPGVPRAAPVNGGNLYELKDKDSVAYLAMVLDLKISANLDSAKLAPLKDMPDFAEGMKNSLVRNLPGVNFGSVVMGKWQGQSLYTFSGATAKKMMVYGHVVLIPSKIYFLLSLVPDGMPVKTKDDFFASVELTH